MWNSININRTNLPVIDISKIDKETIDKINEAFMKVTSAISLDEGGSMANGFTGC